MSGSAKGALAGSAFYMAPYAALGEDLYYTTGELAKMGAVVTIIAGLHNPDYYVKNNEVAHFDQIPWARGASKPNQVHHYATDKNKTYTQACKNITDKYGLDLDDDWNKELLRHQGRHPNAYHDFILDEMRNIDNIANGNKDIFLDLYESEIKSIVRDNPNMLYSDYWKGLKE